MLKKIILCTLSMMLLSGTALAGDGEIQKFNLNGLEVIALKDAATMSADKSWLVGAGEEDSLRASEPGAFDISLNAFIIKIDGRAVLFDAGLNPEAASGMQPALKKAGISPSDINAVVLTHFHNDHIGGLLNNGKPVFSNAEIFVSRVEQETFGKPGNDFLSVYSPKLKTFEFGEEFLPGVTAMDALGHTMGHTIFMVEKDGGSILVIGDLVHIGKIQLANPDVSIKWDTDPKMAAATRKQVFEMAAEKRLPVASMHLPFPGVGVLEKNVNGYTFVETGK